MEIKAGSQMSCCTGCPSGWKDLFHKRIRKEQLWWSSWDQFQEDSISSRNIFRRSGCWYTHHGHEIPLYWPENNPRKNSHFPGWDTGMSRSHYLTQILFWWPQIRPCCVRITSRHWLQASFIIPCRVHRISENVRSGFWGVSLGNEYFRWYDQLSSRML